MRKRIRFCVANKNINCLSSSTRPPPFSLLSLLFVAPRISIFFCLPKCLSYFFLNPLSIFFSSDRKPLVDTSKKNIHETSTPQITREFRLKKDHHHHHHHHHVLYDLLLSGFESVLRFVVVEEDEPHEDDESKSFGEDCERFLSLSSKSSSKEQEEKEIRKRHRGSIVGFCGDAKSAIRTDRSWENNLGLARGRERVSRVVETREKRKNGWRVYYYPTGVGEPVRRSRG